MTYHNTGQNRDGFCFSVGSILWGLSLFPFSLASAHVIIVISHGTIGSVLRLTGMDIDSTWSYHLASWLSNLLGASDAFAEAIDSSFAALAGALVLVCTVRFAASLGTELAQLAAWLLILSMALQSLLVRALLGASPLINLPRMAVCAIYASLCFAAWWIGRDKTKITETEVNQRQTNIAKYSTYGLISAIIVMGFYGWWLLAEFRST